MHHKTKDWLVSQVRIIDEASYQVPFGVWRIDTTSVDANEFWTEDGWSLMLFVGNLAIAELEVAWVEEGPHVDACLMDVRPEPVMCARIVRCNVPPTEIDRNVMPIAETLRALRSHLIGFSVSLTDALANYAEEPSDAKA